MKFAAIYTDSWQAGSHRNTVVRMERFICLDGESALEALRRLGIADATVFLFVGWPALEGELAEIGVKQ